MLVHQLRRINSPALFVTNCDAQFFPLIRSKEHPTEGTFDRVLCDVPCSGDGTSRKNPGENSIVFFFCVLEDCRFFDQVTSFSYHSYNYQEYGGHGMH